LSVALAPESVKDSKFKAYHFQDSADGTLINVTLTHQLDASVCDEVIPPDDLAVENVLVFLNNLPCLPDKVSRLAAEQGYIGTVYASIFTDPFLETNYYMMDRTRVPIPMYVAQVEAAPILAEATYASLIPSENPGRTVGWFALVWFWRLVIGLTAGYKLYLAIQVGREKFKISKGKLNMAVAVCGLEGIASILHMINSVDPYASSGFYPYWLAMLTAAMGNLIALTTTFLISRALSTALADVNDSESKKRIVNTVLFSVGFIPALLGGIGTSFAIGGATGFALLSVLFYLGFGTYYAIEFARTKSTVYSIMIDAAKYKSSSDKAQSLDRLRRMALYAYYSGYATLGYVVFLIIVLVGNVGGNWFFNYIGQMMTIVTSIWAGLAQVKSLEVKQTTTISSSTNDKKEIKS